MASHPRFRSSRTHSIFEVRPARDQRPSNDTVIDGSDAEDAHQPFDALPGERRISSLLEKIKDRCETVRGDEATTVPIFDCRPQGRGGVGAGFTIEDHVQNDIEIEQISRHTVKLTGELERASITVPRSRCCLLSLLLTT
jgi:hypothetical protein